LGMVGERLWRYSRNVRFWEVRGFRSTDEVGEQSRNPGSGVHGGKELTEE